MMFMTFSSKSESGGRYDNDKGGSKIQIDFTTLVTQQIII